MEVILQEQILSYHCFFTVPSSQKNMEVILQEQILSYHCFFTVPS